VRNTIGHWVLATRPKTLVASIIPVSVGVSLAFNQVGTVRIDLICLCFMFSLLVQIATNFANDYFDFLKGADEKRTLGPTRLVESGLIKGTHLRNACYFILIFAFVLGLLLMEKAGASRFLVIVGIASVFCAVCYTGGPFPFAYNGLGDVFVILFFGLIAVCITHYVLVIGSGHVWEPKWMVALSTGFVINNLLVVNNHRDRKTDQEVGKNTLVVLFGVEFAVGLFFFGFFVSCFLCPLFDSRLRLLFVLFPFGLLLVRRLIVAGNKKDYGTILAGTSFYVLLYGVIVTWAIARN
jgi:1,4-dihydroxy-2-naphthoate octaprenyltransferase